MSGGPGLDGAGQVIGVNVAGYRASQLVAFLVPAEHAAALIARAARSPLDPARARHEVASQLRAHSDALLAALGPRLPTQNHQGYELPARPAPFVDCHARGDPAPDQPIHVEHVTCDAKSGIYLGRNLHTGGFSFQHQVMSTRTLDAWRFSQRMQRDKGAHGAAGMRTRVALGVGLAIPAVIVAVALWMQARSQNRSASHIEDRDHVVPPALVRRRPVTLDAFADQLAGLKATADARRAFVEREDPSPAEDDAD